MSFLLAALMLAAPVTAPPARVQPDPSRTDPSAGTRFNKNTSNREVGLNPVPCLKGEFTCGVEALEANQVAEGTVWLRAAARNGDVRALRALGQMQLEGYRVRRDPVGAMEYFYQAALAGDAPSMFILGRAFDKGIGVKTDQKLAAYWLGKAKAAGYNR